MIAACAFSALALVAGVVIGVLWGRHLEREQIAAMVLDVPDEIDRAWPSERKREEIRPS